MFGSTVFLDGLNLSCCVEMIDMTVLLSYKGFSRDVTAAMLEGKNNETAAILEGKTNPVGVELFSYVKTIFCCNKFAWLLVTWVKTVFTVFFEWLF